MPFVTRLEKRTILKCPRLAFLVPAKLHGSPRPRELSGSVEIPEWVSPMRLTSGFAQESSYPPVGEMIRLRVSLIRPHFHEFLGLRGNGLRHSNLDSPSVADIERLLTDLIWKSRFVLHVWGVAASRSTTRFVLGQYFPPSVSEVTRWRGFSAFCFSDSQRPNAATPGGGVAVTFLPGTARDGLIVTAEVLDCAKSAELSGDQSRQQLGSRPPAGFEKSSVATYHVISRPTSFWHRRGPLRPRTERSWIWTTRSGKRR